MFTYVPLLKRENSSVHSPPDVASRFATMLRMPSNTLLSGCTYCHRDLFELPIVVSMVTWSQSSHSTLQMHSDNLHTTTMFVGTMSQCPLCLNSFKLISILYIVNILEDNHNLPIYWWVHVHVQWLLTASVRFTMKFHLTIHNNQLRKVLFYD